MTENPVELDKMCKLWKRISSLSYLTVELTILSADFNVLSANIEIYQRI